MEIRSYKESYNLPLCSKQFLIAKLSGGKHQTEFGIFGSRSSAFTQYFACSAENSDVVGLKKLFDPEYQEVIKVVDINFIIRSSHVISGKSGTGKTSLLKQIIATNKDLVLVYLDLTKLEKNYYLTIFSMYENELYSLIRDDAETIIPEKLISDERICFLIDNYDLVSDKTKNQALDFIYDVGVANCNKVFIAASENIADFSRITLKRWGKEQILQYFDACKLAIPNDAFGDRLFEQPRTASFVGFIGEVSQDLGGIPDNFAMLNQLYLFKLLKQVVEGTPFELSDVVNLLQRVADAAGSEHEQSDFAISRQSMKGAIEATASIVEVTEEYRSYTPQLLLQSLIDYGILAHHDALLGSYYQFCDRSIHHLLLALVYQNTLRLGLNCVRDLVAELLDDPSYCNVIYYYLELSDFEQVDEVLDKAKDMRNLVDSAEMVLGWVMGKESITDTASHIKSKE